MSGWFQPPATEVFTEQCCPCWDPPSLQANDTGGGKANEAERKTKQTRIIETSDWCHCCLCSEKVPLWGLSNIVFICNVMVALQNKQGSLHFLEGLVKLVHFRFLIFENMTC